MSEPDKLIKKWSTLLNSTNNATAMLIEPMEVKIKIDRGNQIHKELESIMNKKIKRRLSYDVSFWRGSKRETKYFESAKKMRRFVNRLHQVIGPELTSFEIVKTFCYRNHHPRHKSWYYSTEPNQFICYERY